MIFNGIKFRLSKCNDLKSYLHKRNTNFKSNRPILSYFPFLTKMALLKLFVIRRSIIVQNFIVPRWLVQVFIHIRILNVRHFGMGIMTLKSWRWGHLKWHDLPTEFYEHPLIGSKVIRVAHRRTDRQNGDLTNVTIFLKKVFKNSRNDADNNNNGSIFWQSEWSNPIEYIV
jgi:hypothetical protein